MIQDCREKKIGRREIDDRWKMTCEKEKRSMQERSGLEVKRTMETHEKE